MRHFLLSAALLLATLGCTARQRPQPPADTLLRLVTEPRALTLCEGMRRHLAVSVSWAGEARPDVAGLPEIRWLSRDSSIVRVDSSNAIVAVRPGSASVVAHARLGPAYGRTVVPVVVRPGAWDPATRAEPGELACRAG